MKKVLAIVLALVMVLGCIACTKAAPAAEAKTETKVEAKAETKAEAAPAAEAEAAPAAEAEVAPAESMVVTGDPMYDTMSCDELYELAKAEGGEITIYSDTSKISKMADAFMADYPDLTLVPSNLKAKEITNKIPVEVDSGNIVADAVFCSDASGIFYNEFYEDGYFEAYYPADICAHMDPAVLKNGLPVYTGSNPWFYNTTMYPDGCPINNWWDIVELNEDGSEKWTIFCKNIAGENSYMGLYAELSLYSAELEAAYKEKYGTDLEYTYDASKVPGVPANNAAFEFLYRLSQKQNMTFIDDGDEIMKALHECQTPALGLGSANKLDNRDDNGYTIAWCVGLKPFTGLSNPNFLYCVPGCDNPAGARLFIKWAMGGENADTKSISILERAGQWYLRDDVKSDVNDYSYAEMGLVEPDSAYVYETYTFVNDFWIYWYDQNH